MEAGKRREASASVLARRVIGSVALLACLVAAGVSACVAGAFTGTPAAVQLAQQVLGSYGSVPALRSVSTGSVFYCQHGGSVAPYIGAAPPRYCRPAVERSEIDLSNGLAQRVITKLTAKGVPALTLLIDSSGEYITLGSGRCWLRRPSPGPLSRPPFHFDPKERLSIAGHRGGLILLRGIEGPFSELDSIDPHTDHVVAITERARLRGGKRFRRTDRFTELAQPTPPPTPTPLC